MSSPTVTFSAIAYCSPKTLTLPNHLDLDRDFEKYPALLEGTEAEVESYIFACRAQKNDPVLYMFVGGFEEIDENREDLQAIKDSVKPK